MKLWETSERSEGVLGFGKSKIFIVNIVGGFMSGEYGSTERFLSETADSEFLKSAGSYDAGAEEACALGFSRELDEGTLKYLPKIERERFVG